MLGACYPPIPSGALVVVAVVAEVPDHGSTVSPWSPASVGGNVPRERRTCAASAMRIVSWMGAGEGLERPMQEMDGMRRADTLMRGSGQEPGWVARCSILSRKKGRVGVVGKEEGVVRTET
jgi:hypothetical protein